MTLADGEKKLKNVMKKLDSVTSNFIMEKETWDKNLASVEENWRLKCESLKAQTNGHVDDELQKNLGELTLIYEKLKVPSWPLQLLSACPYIMLLIQDFNICLVFWEEHQSFRDIADTMIEDKEQEIAKLLNDLHLSLEAKPANSLPFYTLYSTKFKIRATPFGSP